MLERIPQINPNILTQCSSNLSSILMSKYLLSHGYYDCSREILELYLKMMRYKSFPNEGEIIAYLSIIDRYAKDNINIKYSEFGTYNFLLSLNLFYEGVKISEQKESDGILLRETMKFMLNLLKGLQMAGMKSFVGDEAFSFLVKGNGELTRSQKADELIIEKFLHLTPVISVKGKKYLSEEYCYMVLYMHSFPDVCIPWINQEDKSCMEIIKQKHMLYLLNVLLDSTQNNAFGFDRISLYRVREILRERYNTKY